jgi:hypothetical protein
MKKIRSQFLNAHLSFNHSHLFVTLKEEKLHNVRKGKLFFI